MPACITKVLNILLILFFTIEFCYPQEAQFQFRQRPNIIFILTDDQRWDALGFTGNPLAHTPEMNRLAREGVYFSHALVTTPICAASRASILTGLYERAHGYTFHATGVKPEYMDNSYPALLKAAGYTTAFYGKFGAGKVDMEKLFDTYDSYDRNDKHADRRGYYFKTIGQDTVHLTRYTGQQAIDFIKGYSSDKPFCLSLSFSAPHAHDPAPEQYFWQDETEHHLEDVEIPEARLADDEFFNRLPSEVKEGFNRTRWHWRFDTPEKYQHSVKGYYRMIAGIDNEIASIRKVLNAKGLSKNTVIILMGDNGYFLGERQLAGKWLMYDNSIRVPLIIYDPVHTNHREIPSMVLNVDVSATILDLAGIKVPAAWHGQSLVPFLTGEDTALRDTVLIEHLWEFEHIPPSEGVRTSEWKYFRYVNDKSKEELYNVVHDPEETRNLVSDPNHQVVVSRLREKCNQLIERYHEPIDNAPPTLSVAFVRNPARTMKDILTEYTWEAPPAFTVQRAYQILVSSSQTNIDNNLGDVWNSGKMSSSDSSGIEHGGSALKEKTTYYWKVRVWGDGNRLGEYSRPHSFEVSDR